MANEPSDSPSRETRLEDLVAAYLEAERLMALTFSPQSS